MTNRMFYYKDMGVNAIELMPVCEFDGNLNCDVDWDLSVESRGRLEEIIDKSHLPKAEHGKADQHPKRHISPLLLVFYENRVIHKVYLPLLDIFTQTGVIPPQRMRNPSRLRGGFLPKSPEWGMGNDRKTLYNQTAGRVIP